jgi:hypothetical protein
MGGFVSRTGHPIVTIKQLTDNKEYMSAIHDVKADDINDKSKSNALSKGVALSQGLWFMTQCIARHSQHLPVTQLEVATLAFAVVNVFIWFLWWAKPLDVEQPITIGPIEEPQDTEPTTSPLILRDKFFGMLNGNYSPYLPTESTSVPIFWSLDSKEANDAEKNIPVYIECLLGTVFGGIHCAAWNADFSSTIEMWMWNSCSSIVTAIPGVFVVLSAWHAALAVGSALRSTLSIIFTNIFGILFPLYIIARLFLITIPFTSLRALPPGAFVDVDWSVYIPHL